MAAGLALERVDLASQADIDATQPLNPFHTLNQAAPAFWCGLAPLDGGPRLYDLGVNGLHGTIVNPGGSASALWTPGPYGLRALTFDGSTQYVSCPQATRSLVNVSLWALVRVDAVQQGLMIYNGDDTAGYGLVIGPGSASLTLGLLNGGVGWGSSTFAATIGAWALLGATIDANSNCSFFANGQPAGVNGSVSRVPAAGACTIGREAANYSGRYFQGAIAEAGIVPRALTPAEWALKYQLLRAGYPGLLNRVGAAYAPGASILAVSAALAAAASLSASPSLSAAVAGSLAGSATLSASPRASLGLAAAPAGTTSIHAAPTLAGGLGATLAASATFLAIPPGGGVSAIVSGPDWRMTQTAPADAGAAIAGPDPTMTLTTN